MFKTKDGYKLELHTSEKKKVIWQHKKKNKINENKKNGENIASLKVVKVVYSNLI